MPDFELYVRVRIGLGSERGKERADEIVREIGEQRLAEIIREIAEHMRAAYEEALAGGAPEMEALSRAESPFLPWDRLRRDIGMAERAQAAGEGVAEPHPIRPLGRLLGGAALLGAVWQDLRFGIRTFRRRPFFTAMAIVTLGLGIGSATTMFSIIDGVLIRDLPYRDPGNLVSVWRAWPGWQGREGLDFTWDHVHFTWGGYRNVRDHATTLTDVAAFMHADLTIRGEGEPERVSVGRASANLFDLLGVQPILGRAFREEELPAGAGEVGAPVILLSHELWSRRYGRDRDILGRSIHLGDTVYEIVGVLPAGLRVNSDLIRTWENEGEVDAGLRDVWIPLRSYGDSYNSYEILARLAPGASVEQARAEIQALLTVGPEDQLARVETRKSFLTQGFGTPLLLLLGASGLLLLVACVNVAGLLVGEAGVRTREVELRYALGAGRGRVIRQLLTENVLLGLMGAMLGAVLCALGTQALLSVAPPLPRLEEVTFNGRVLLFAVGAGVGTSLFFGLVPASTLAGRSSCIPLSSRGGWTSRRSHSLQAGVVSIQVALTVILLVAGGLFGRSLLRLMAVDPGFASEGLVALEVSFSGTPLSTGESAVASTPPAWELLLREVENTRGVTAVSGTDKVPFAGDGGRLTFHFEREGERITATHSVRYVLPGYHEVMDIPLKGGRLLTAADQEGGPRVMLVSEGLARRFWPGESPIGATMLYGGAHPVTIVGVVGDVRTKALGSAAEPTVYLSALQYPRAGLSLVVETEGDPAGVMPALRAAIRSVDPSVLVGSPNTLTTLKQESEADDRFRTILVLTFATLATVLAAVGIFGVTARSVAARTREMGVRMALGADGPGLIRHAVRGSMISATAGAAIGLVGALWITRLIQHFLFGIESTDPTTYLGVCSFILLVCLGAAYLPASRVTRIAPLAVITEA